MAKLKSHPANPSEGPLLKEQREQRDKAFQIGEHIGRELRAMFNDVVAEPVPERFQKLLEELEQSKSKS